MDEANKEKKLPIFQIIFGDQWEDLPQVLKDHYAVRAFSSDRVVVEGHLDVRVTWPVRIMSRLTGMLVPYSGDAVPVKVVFSSGVNEAYLQLQRLFQFECKTDTYFQSRMEHIHGNIVVEFMRFGIGWKAAYDWDGSKVILSHVGYVWRIFGYLIPMPMELVIGRGYAEEVAISDNEFSMWTHSKHRLFGEMFGYSGKFKVTEVSCGPS